MGNKKLKRKIATCLINSELNCLDKSKKHGWFSAGIRLSHTQMVEGLVDFILGMVAREENSNSRESLKQRILDGLKRLDKIKT
jgi:hypothetical protein